MKLISNGVMNEVKVLKHFKLENDEYVLYSKVDGAYIGLIDQNKIVMASMDKGPILMKVLGGMINDNIDSSCTLLDNNIDMIFEEVGSQKVNMTQDMLNKFLNSSIDVVNNISENNVLNDQTFVAVNSEPIVNNTVENVESNVMNNNQQIQTPNASSVVDNNTQTSQVNNTVVSPQKKKNNKMIIIIISIVLVIAIGVCLFIFKDKLFSGSSSGGGSTSNVKTIEGVEIPNGYNTYAARRNQLNSNKEVVESMTYVIRYDKEGNFKYMEYTDSVSLEEELKEVSESEMKEKVKEYCKSMKTLDYDEYSNICYYKDRMYTYGYRITNKTIESGILNYDYKDDYLLRSSLSEFDSVSSESKAKQWFDKLKDRNDINNYLLIINNEKYEG